MRYIGIFLKYIFVTFVSLIASFLIVTFGEYIVLAIYLRRVSLHDYDASYLMPLNIVLLLLIAMQIGKYLLKRRARSST